MKMAKKLTVALFAAGALLVAACVPPEGMYSTGTEVLPEVDSVHFTIWCPDEFNGTITELINEYAMMHSETPYEVIVESKSEEEVTEALLEDPNECAEVFLYYSEDVMALQKKNAFSLISRDKGEMSITYSKGSFTSGKPDEWLFGYPFNVESENILIYDKGVYSAEDVQSLDTIFSKADGAGKKVYLNMTDGSGILAMFVGAGCRLGFNKNGKAVCDFANEEGLAAYPVIQAYVNNSARTEEDFIENLGSDIAAGIVSSSMAEEAEEILGANCGFAKLPTYSLNGEEAQMYSAGTYRLMGLRRMLDVDQAPYIMDLCYYLISADNQLTLYSEHRIALTSYKAIENLDYQEDELRYALSVQSDYSVPHYQVAEDFWTSAADLAKEMANGSAADAEAVLSSFSNAALGRS